MPRSEQERSRGSVYCAQQCAYPFGRTGTGNATCWVWEKPHCVTRKAVGRPSELMKGGQICSQSTAQTAMVHTGRRTEAEP